ncbi:uncharacterized protein LOC110031488 [Phalaenopsis equestris]|uniref:uncharacterized protein LOC110031488 n=1 Tax=Phalaenopsis equestris TaxID=78828 RepID=UPI0009E5B6F0|nr:uncharacterized protein LOC110031488 [Phalaenopsis equestris]
MPINQVGEESLFWRKMQRSEREGELMSSATTARGIHRSHRSMVEIDGLPTCDPGSFLGKKEAKRMRLALMMVHASPIVVFSCIIVLWFLSRKLRFSLAGLITRNEHIFYLGFCFGGHNEGHMSETKPWGFCLVDDAELSAQYLLLCQTF